MPLFFPTPHAIHTNSLLHRFSITPLTCLWRTTAFAILGTVDLQRFVLQKMESGLGWESANHFRNLSIEGFRNGQEVELSSPGAIPASGVLLPEKNAVREKHALQPDQIQRLCWQMLASEPVRTMVLLGILTGMRIGEILGLP